MPCCYSTASWCFLYNMALTLSIHPLPSWKQKRAARLDATNDLRNISLMRPQPTNTMELPNTQSIPNNMNFKLPMPKVVFYTTGATSNNMGEPQQQQCKP